MNNMSNLDYSKLSNNYLEFTFGKFYYSNLHMIDNQLTKNVSTIICL